MMQYLKSPLSTDEQTALKALHEQQRSEHETLMKDSSLTQEQKMAKAKELIAKHITELLPYVATDKQDAFKKVMEGKMSMSGKKQDMKDQNQQNRQDFKDQAKEKREDFREQTQQKKMAISEKLQSQLASALEKLPLEKIQKVLSNVEAAISRVTASTMAEEKKARMLSQLQDIKEIIQDKIDDLSGGSSDSSLLQEVLTGSGSGQ